MGSLSQKERSVRLWTTIHVHAIMPRPTLTCVSCGACFFFVEHSSNVTKEEEEKEIFSSSFFSVGKEQEEALLLFH